jgi:AmmeMemoRadiSam system protein A
MGRIIASYIMPHPPIIIPGVGRGAETDADSTITAANRAAIEIAREAPGTIILSSPHAPCFSDFMHISGQERLEGDFGRFRCPEVKIGFENNLSLVERIEDKAREQGLPAGSLDEASMERMQISGRLDHGALVPLYFVTRLYKDFKLVHISTPFLPTADLYALGKCIAQAVRESDEKVVYIASADLSHRLKRDAPAGYSPKGKEYDEQLIQKLKESDVHGILSIDEAFMEEAGECGTRSIIIMLGAMSGNSIQTDMYSYEGPFGVGYLVARVSAAGPQTDELDVHPKETSPHVRLAQETLEAYVREGEKIKIPGWVPEELLTKRAGVFVSLKKNGRLRGCIGTIAPAKSSIAEEIAENAISAGTMDPRFDPVAPGELSRLIYSVDVLGEPEKIESMDELDVKNYGVIVTSGFKRGLLLPDLEGVDTPEQQVEIALQKAGIRAYEEYSMERFRVERYR